MRNRKDKDRCSKQTAPSRDKRRRIIKDRVFIYGWLAIPIIAWLVFYVYVNIDMIVKSFYNTNVYGEYMWKGLENYKTIIKYFSSTQTRMGYWNLKTLLNSLTIYPLLVVLELLNIFVAYYIYKKSFGHRFFNIILFTPALISLSVWAQLYRLLLDPQVGYINHILGKIGMEGIIPANGWFGTESIAWPMVIVFCIWTGIGGSTMAYYCSALNRIPRELFEAATLDGATEMKEIIHIICPLVWPLFCTRTTFAVGSIFSLATQPLLVTTGGPNGASTTLGLLIIEQTKAGSNLGLVCCLGVFILVLGGTFSKLYHKFISSFVEEVEY